MQLHPFSLSYMQELTKNNGCTKDCIIICFTNVGKLTKLLNFTVITTANSNIIFNDNVFNHNI